MCFRCTNKRNTWNISTGDKFATENVQPEMLARSRRPSDQQVDINKGRFIRNFIRQKMSFQRVRSHWVLTWWNFPSGNPSAKINFPVSPLLTATDFPTSKSSLSFDIGLSICFNFVSWSNFRPICSGHYCWIFVMVHFSVKSLTLQLKHLTEHWSWK